MQSISHKLASVSIRRPDPADFDDISMLMAGGSAQASLVISRLSADDVYAYMAEDERVFGFVTCGAPLIAEKGVGEIIAIFVSPQHRGFGMGKKLLVRGLSVLKRRGFEIATLWVNEDNLVDGFLESLGFELAVETRELNLPDGNVALQRCFCRPLDDYF